VDIEPEALRTLASHVWDLVMENVNGPSSPVASLLERQIGTTTTNGVRWGARSALFDALSPFLELRTELELHGSGQNADLAKD
jgi:hypothetical protein